MVAASSHRIRDVIARIRASHGNRRLMPGAYDATSALFEPVRPLPLPRKEDCIFYHDLELPGGETIVGAWDIRGRFDQYVGYHPLAGKTVLDVGTASGFIAFGAEQAGALVTAAEARGARDFQQLQFRDTLYHYDRASWIRQYNEFLVKLKNSFWYSWHRLNSYVEVVYAPIDAFPLWSRRFDVVIAGAIWNTSPIPYPRSAIWLSSRTRP